LFHGIQYFFPLIITITLIINVHYSLLSYITTIKKQDVKTAAEKHNKIIIKFIQFYQITEGFFRMEDRFRLDQRTTRRNIRNYSLKQLVHGKSSQMKRKVSSKPFLLTIQKINR